jgi:hypothetical protein
MSATEQSIPWSTERNAAIPPGSGYKKRDPSSYPEPRSDLEEIFDVECGYGYLRWSPMMIQPIPGGMDPREYLRVPPQQILDRAIEIIEDIITAQQEDEIEEYQAQLYETVAEHTSLLGQIVLDSSRLINVRAMAARLFLGRVAPLGGDGFQEQLARQAMGNKSPLVRLGAVLGLADAGDIRSIRPFLMDSFPEVAKTAQEILDDAYPDE